MNNNFLFDTYHPNYKLNPHLPEYFSKIRFYSHYPTYLSIYNIEDFAQCNLYKIRGLDAGFALKNGTDIIALHNNSLTKYLSSILLNYAILNGGNELDHFDGFLTSIYRTLFPIVTKISPWLEEYAPQGWDYKPVDFASSHVARCCNTSKEYQRMQALYLAGKPSVLYRKRR